MLRGTWSTNGGVRDTKTDYVLSRGEDVHDRTPVGERGTCVGDVARTHSDHGGLACGAACRGIDVLVSSGGLCYEVAERQLM